MGRISEDRLSEGCEWAGPGSGKPWEPLWQGQLLGEGNGKKTPEIVKKGSAMMQFVFWVAHSYTLPTLEAGRKLGGYGSGPGKGWGGCRIGRWTEVVKWGGGAVGWGTWCERKGGLLCWWAHGYRLSYNNALRSLTVLRVVSKTLGRFFKLNRQGWKPSCNSMIYCHD